MHTASPDWASSKKTTMPAPSLRQRFVRSIIVSLLLLALGVTIGVLSAVREVEKQEELARARLAADR
jgi:hypothetical protein